MIRNGWEGALNLVDEKIEEFRHAPFEHLAKRPYRSELPDSDDHVCFTLFVDRLSETSVRVVLAAREAGGEEAGRSFAHGFDMQRNGSVSDVPADVLWEFC